MNSSIFDSRYHSSKIPENVIEGLIKKHNDKFSNDEIGQEDIQIMEEHKL